MTCNWCGKDVPDDKSCPAGFGASKEGTVSVKGSFHIECIWKALEAEVDKHGGRPDYILITEDKHE